MKINFNVKYKFKVNGKEYASLEEMPAEVRETYEKAVSGNVASGPVNIQSLSAGKIVFNGQEYENADSMPPDVRRMYETVMESVKNGQISQGGNAAGTAGTAFGFKDEGTTVFPNTSKPVSPESFISPRVLIIAAVIIALLIGIYFIFGTGGLK